MMITDEQIAALMITAFMLFISCVSLLESVNMKRKEVKQWRRLSELYYDQWKQEREFTTMVLRGLNSYQEPPQGTETMLKAAALKAHLNHAYPEEPRP